MKFDIVHIVMILVTLLISIGLHEYAHALISYKLGDPTPKLQKRLTPNPLRHLDPYGTLMMVVMVISGRGIWRGKPVQINPACYKNPLKGELLVALGGPATNLVLAVLGVFILLLYGRIAGFSQIEVTQNIFSSLNGTGNLVIRFWGLFSMINISLAIFNLLPIPPLDGFTIIKAFWHKAARFILQYKTYVIIWFLVLILGPGRNAFWHFFTIVSSTIFSMVFSFFSFVVY